MKALVIFYSYEGNTACAAKAIGAACGADCLELKPVGEHKRRGFSKYVWGGRQVLTKAEPPLEPLTADPAGYDLLFLGTPVWAGTYAPAWRTFFAGRHLAGKDVALFCCYGGSAGGTFRHFRRELADCRVLGELGLRDPGKRDTERQLQRAAEWTREMCGLHAKG
jgi:flavodoxin